MQTSLTPLFLSPALPSEFLTYVLRYHIYPTTLIVCSSAEGFAASVAEELHQTSAKFQAEAAEPPSLSPDGQASEDAEPVMRPESPARSTQNLTRLLSSSPLYQVATAKHLRVAYVPTVTHLRAYLSVFTPQDSAIVAPPAPFSEERARSRSQPPRILVYGFLDLHRDTSEWSAQGIGNSLSALVEVVHWLSWQAVVVEPRRPQAQPQCQRQQQSEDEEDDGADSPIQAAGEHASHDTKLEDTLGEKVPILSGGARRPFLGSDDAGSWTGRRVEVGRILARWFRFERCEWDQGQ